MMPHETYDSPAHPFECVCHGQKGLELVEGCSFTELPLVYYHTSSICDFPMWFPLWLPCF